MEITDLLLSCLGTLTAILLMIGAGSAFLGKWQESLAQPWPLLLSILIGWHICCFLTLICGALGLLTATGIALVVYLPLLLLSGFSLFSGKSQRLTEFMSCLRAPKNLAWPYKTLIIFCFLFAATLTLIALAPPTKHDDLYYHLLIAQRALINHSFLFYSTPILTTGPYAAFDSMFVILLAFLPANSSSLFSLAIAFLLILMVYVHLKQVSYKRALLAVAILLFALSNAIWWVSSSSTSWCALIATFLFLWLSKESRLRQNIGAAKFGFILGLLISALLLSKLSFVVPGFLAILLSCWLMRTTWKKALLSTFMCFCALTLSIGPWCLREFLFQGNPLSVVSLPAPFQSRIFDPELLRGFNERIRRVNQFTPERLMGNNSKKAKSAPVSAFSPLWGLINWLKENCLLRGVNLLHPLILLAGTATLAYRQHWAILIWVYSSSYILGLLVPHELRFYSVLVYGLFVEAFENFPSSWLPQRIKTILPLAVLAASLPAIFTTAYYSSSFLPVVFHWQKKEDFIRKYTAIYEVYEWIQTNLDAKEQICISCGIARPFYLQRIGLSPEKITIAEKEENFSLWHYMKRNHLGYLISASAQMPTTEFQLVKSFPNVIMDGTRQPGKEPPKGTAYLYRLLP